ncbi:MAG: polyprenyl synthetase family protein [Thermodesulfobacteriota bacterium]
MTNSQELLAGLKQQAALVDQAMRHDLAGIRSPQLGEIISHAIFQGGKRLRPLLCMLSASLLAEPPHEAMRLSLVFEYLHAASLLHDDVIDHAELRRGAKTANAIWGASPVILAGDFLHAHAMALASEVGGQEAMALVGRATAAMVEAEFLQMENAFLADLSEARYFAVLDGKTAALIAAACETGIALAGGSPEQRRALFTYGANLGLAFQIVDDLLDYNGDPEKTGKAVGNDFQEGKMTLPLILAMTRAGTEDRALLAGWLAATPTARAGVFGEGREVIRRNQGFELARDRANELVGEAIAGLASFPKSMPRQTLEGVARYVLERDR